MRNHRIVESDAMSEMRSSQEKRRFRVVSASFMFHEVSVRRHRIFTPFIRRKQGDSIPETIYREAAERVSE